MRAKVISYAADIGARLLRGIAGGISTVASIGATIFLTLPLVFFLLKDGSRGWALVVSRLPGRRADLDRAGRQSFTVLAAFLRGTAIVATFDATVVAIGLWLIGVPLILPLAVADVHPGVHPDDRRDPGRGLSRRSSRWPPAASATPSGRRAVAAREPARGRTGLTVRDRPGGQLHPALVLLAVTGGASIVGIAGAFLAVPTLAVTLTFIRVLWPMQIPLELQR